MNWIRKLFGRRKAPPADVPQTTEQKQKMLAERAKAEGDKYKLKPKPSPRSDG